MLEPDDWSYAFAEPVAVPGAAESAHHRPRRQSGRGRPRYRQGPFCNPYGPCEAWCALVRHVGVGQRGDRRAVLPVHREHRYLGRRADGGSCPWVLPAPGDALLYGTGPQTTATSVHTGLVVQVWPDDAVVTVEGDAGPAPSGQLSTIINGPFLVRDSASVQRRARLRRGSSPCIDPGPRPPRCRPRCGHIGSPPWQPPPTTRESCRNSGTGVAPGVPGRPGGSFLHLLRRRSTICPAHPYSLGSRTLPATPVVPLPRRRAATAVPRPTWPGPSKRWWPTSAPAYLGEDLTVRLSLCCLMAEGHLLVEDHPGVGKTTLAKALARSLGLGFGRVQLTADLLPADVTGAVVFDRDTGLLAFRPGPVFTNVLLADELNRASPKAQSALLEAMEERQVSADGTSHPLPRPFMVHRHPEPLRRGRAPFPSPTASATASSSASTSATPTARPRISCCPRPGPARPPRSSSASATRFPGRLRRRRRRHLCRPRGARLCPRPRPRHPQPPRPDRRRLAPGRLRSSAAAAAWP